MEPRDHVTVIIAAKDEEATIGSLIARCRRYAAQVIVVDGHSRDGTVTVSSEAGARVLFDGGRGKGEALRVGIAAVETSIIVFLDADGSHDPDDIPRVIAPICEGRADHVSGSRLIGGSSELHGGFDEFFRLAGSSLITACVNWRFGVRLSETQNGFRAIRTSVVRQLNLRSNEATIEQEMIVKTLRMGFRMAEVPAHEYKRLFGSSHLVLWKVAPFFVISLIWYLFFAPVGSMASEPAREIDGQRSRPDAAPDADPQVVGSPRIRAHG
jgi:glycosyltransferase involved in cell wall biosynthesis